MVTTNFKKFIQKKLKISKKGIQIQYQEIWSVRSQQLKIIYKRQLVNDFNNYKILKKNKVHHILRYYFRCTIQPSISVKSDCAEYESAINKYAASKFGLDQLIQFNKSSEVISKTDFNTLRLFGINGQKQQKLNYLNEITITEKQSIQNEIFIPSYPISRPKENKFLFNFCYFFKEYYSQTFIASGGNSHIFTLKPEIYQYNASNDEQKDNLEKSESLNKYITKHLVIKKPKDHFHEQVNSAQTQQGVDHEITIVAFLKGVTCLFLPKYYLNIDKNSVYHKKLFIDYLYGQTLDEYVNLHSNTISTFTKMYILYQILQSLRFISQYGITHLDVKEQNIIVVRNLLCKLVDFGQSYHYKACGANHKPKFTIPYGAPEVVTSVKGRQFTQKSDSYSFAIMMHSIIYGRHPFFAYDIDKFRKLHHNKQYYKKIFYVPEQNEKYGSKIIIPILDQLIMRCLDFDEKKRPFLDWFALIIKSYITYLTISD